MHHPKHLYITGIATGAIVGLIASISFAGLVSSLSFYETIQYVVASDMAFRTIITMIMGASVGLVVAFIIHKSSRS